MIFLDQMFHEIERFRRVNHGSRPSRIRMTPESVDEVKKQAGKQDEPFLPQPSLWGVPVLMDDDLAVEWRIEWDGPRRSW